MTEIVLTSSVLILLLAILRQALRGRVSPGVQYGLWLLVAARLLIPGTLFTAPVSVLGAAEDFQTTLHRTFPDPVNLPEPVIDGIAGQLPRQEPRPAVPSDAAYPEADAAAGYQPAAPEAEITRRAYSWPDIIWKTGVVTVGGTMAASNFIFCLRLRKSRKRLALPSAAWSGKLPVYEVDGLPSPCLFGLFRPAVYLNGPAMGAEHPEHILAHEYAHYRHGDHVWAVLRCVCLAVHWYNPLVWWAAALSRQDCELACDAAALRRLGDGARIDYGHTLLGMVSRGRNPSALLRTATTMTAGKRAMKERIALIVKQPRMRKITLVLLALAVCGTVAVTFGGKAAAAETDPEPAPGADMPSAVYISQAYSSQSADSSYITDPDEVARLWELYQSFEYEDAYDPAGMGGWPVSVSFRNSEGWDTAYFILYQYGVYTQDGEHLRLKNIDEIYAEFLRLSRSAPVTPAASALTEEAMVENARSIVEQIQGGADVDEWLPLMNYMDWSFLRQAAVEAGMDEGDGSAAAVNIIGTVTQYVEAHGGSMTMAEYLYVLSATAGLDGAVSEGYAYMIHRMYIMNPSQFAYVVLEQLPEERRNAVMDLFCSEWYYDQVSSWDLPTREEAIAQLEADLSAGVFAAPSEMTLRGAGSTFQFKLSNASGIYALTYASSDTSVAVVDNSGVVTAVGPGEAVISAHYEGAGGPLDFACRVRCEWEDIDLSEFRTLDDGVRVKEDGSEVIFTAYRQGWKFSPPDWERGYTATYSSSNLAVATVDPEGLVYSVGPGEAVITMHYLDSRGPREYTCLVHSDWDDTESLGIDDASYRRQKETFQLYGEEIAAWQKRYEDFVANMPSAPTTSVTYKDPAEIESLAAAYLRDYYNDYFNDFFARDPFTSDKENIGEVFVYITKFDMNFEAAVDYSLRIVPAFELPNGDLLSAVIQAKYGLTTTIIADRELSAGGPPKPPGELTNEWQRSFTGFVFEIPAAPDQELVYDGMTDGGLYLAVMARLEEYARDYVDAYGNRDYNTRFSHIALEEGIPESAEYGEQLTVYYRVACVQDRTYEGETYTLATQTGDRLATTFTVYDQMNLMGQMLAGGASGSLSGRE